MFRKLVLAAGATAVIAAAVLSPTTASAKGWKHHHGHHGWHGWGPGFGISFVGPGYYGYRYRDCYTVRRVVWTKYGKRIRRIRVCE